jgi:hypothetical protein
VPLFRKRDIFNKFIGAQCIVVHGLETKFEVISHNFTLKKAMMANEGVRKPGKRTVGHEKQK